MKTGTTLASTLVAIFCFVGFNTEALMIRGGAPSEMNEFYTTYCPLFKGERQPALMIIEDSDTQTEDATVKEAANKAIQIAKDLCDQIENKSTEPHIDITVSLGCDTRTLACVFMGLANTLEEISQALDGEYLMILYADDDNMKDNSEEMPVVGFIPPMLPVKIRGFGDSRVVNRGKQEIAMSFSDQASVDKREHLNKYLEVKDRMDDRAAGTIAVLDSKVDAQEPMASWWNKMRGYTWGGWIEKPVNNDQWMERTDTHWMDTDPEHRMNPFEYLASLFSGKGTATN